MLPGTDRYVHCGAVHCPSVINGFGAPLVYNLGFVVTETTGVNPTNYFPKYESSDISANTYVAYATSDAVVSMERARFCFNLISKVEEGEMNVPNDPVYYVTVCLRKFLRYSGLVDGPHFIYAQKSAPVTYDSDNVVISFDEPFSVKLAEGECLVASVLMASVNNVASTVKAYDNITFSFDLFSSVSV